MMSTHEVREHYLSGKKIVVAGAGVAGLAFAITLRKLWSPSVEPPVVVIYDRDAKEPSVGREGYSLSLHGTDRDSGLYALKQLGLPNDIIDLAIFRVQDRPMISVRAKAAAGIPTASIRIARKVLRRVLAEAASASPEIRWGTACTLSAETDEECDILVAADGASRACLRPDDKLRFAGPARQHSLVWALGILEAAPRPKRDNRDPQQAQEIIRQVRELGKGITEPFKTILNATDPSTTLVLNAMDKRPFPHDMKAGPVLFIGYSNHAVSSFAGNGANLALKDGNLDCAMATYDRRSLPRAIATLESSHWRIKVGHATGLQCWMYRIFFTTVGVVMTLLGR
ncbi:putative monooxygenase [Xylaria longipes]|nr:putative monooxygenase [Xylaria longipes]